MEHLNKKEKKLIKKYPHLFPYTYSETAEYRLFNGFLVAGGKAITTVTWGVISGDPLSNQALAELLERYTKEDYTNQVVARFTKEIESIYTKFEDYCTEEFAVELDNRVHNLEESGKELAVEVNNIKGVISDTATTTNKLITQEEMDLAIAQNAARYITSNTSGDTFASKAALVAGPYYYNGVTVTLQKNDYAIVSIDETHSSAQCRYLYTGSVWNFQYVIETSLTPEQRAALDSGATTEKINMIETNSQAISQLAQACNEEFTRLDNAIIEEGEARQTDISNLGKDISNEVTARTAAISALETQLENKANIAELTAETVARQNADTQLQEQIDKLQGLVEITYSELKTLRDNSQLVAGTYYRITDYVATTTQENTQATTNQYDIIVLATSTNTLSEEARAIQHSGDTYFANSNLNAWKVWYCLDNDTNRFAWASASGKGVIYKLTDEYFNTAWYDFKGIQVKNTTSSDRFYYLFDNSGVDASLSNSTSIPSCYGNNLGFYIISNKYTIGCNIFYGGNNFRYNTIGNGFYNNTIGNSFQINTIGNIFHDNTIGNYFYNNTIGNTFVNNTIGNGFYSNTIGNNFRYNTIGNDFQINTIGNYFYNNTIGNTFVNNTIGNDFKSNNTTSITTQPTNCSFPCGVSSKITTSTTSLDSNRTYYIGSDGSLKSLS